ncbi:hypothetical protein [Microcoleus sp. N3A4]|uniref:hypothetical protein n=1 Tax=Microcoleus sp. N3A4 TaxID=3055379 RepID=UPI002FD2111C
MIFKEGRRKKEEGRRKREEERGKRKEERGKKEDFFPSPTLPISHSLAPLPLSPVTTVRILPVKCFNYFCLTVKSRKKFMKNQGKLASLVFSFLLKKWQYTLLV